MVWAADTTGRGRPHKAGEVAGWQDAGGYISIGFDGRTYRRARLAILLMTGEWPPKGTEPDHKNRVRTDDRWDNLRLATRSQQSQNQKRDIAPKSGCRGVYWNSNRRMWYPRIQLDGKTIHFGYTEDLPLAIAIRKEAEAKYFGKFLAV